MTDRLRGRAGVARRQRLLMREPLCRMCLAKGRRRPVDEFDHIVPLHKGGLDIDSNLQGLCFDCHREKTLRERSYGAASHPDWLEPSAIPLRILCGPPCAGKSTHIERNAADGDIIIELDAIMAELDPDYAPWREDRRDLLDEAIRERNRRLGSLARARHGQAWVALAAPTKAEREWWQARLGGKVLLLNPGAAECKRRAMALGLQRAAYAVDEWERRSRQPWKRKLARVAVGVDGWPAR